MTISWQDLSDVYLTNMYTLLENLSMPVKPPGEGEHLCRFISKAPGQDNHDNNQYMCVKYLYMYI